MFDGEIVKKIPFQKKFRPFYSQDRVQDKVGLENFHQKLFFAKSLKISCLMEKLWKKNPLNKNLDLKHLLVLDRVLDRVHDRVQDKVGLENFHQELFFEEKP